MGGLTAPQTAVAGAFRDEWGRVVATLIRVTGDWDLSEECAQEAFEQALRWWAREGVPERPGAWLTTVARNRALDRLRRSAVETTKLQIVGAEPKREDVEERDVHDIEDDQLRLIFTCCHPALPFDARVALTLRAIAGLTTPEIARSFLVSEQTMAKRLVRAKQKIRKARIPYRVPPAHLLPRRTTGVLAVLYLLFNEGYSASAGEELVRLNLCDDAIRLTRSLASLLPEDPEPAGLLALMLFQSSRRVSRVDHDGELVTLEDQDRSLWDQASIDEARGLLDVALKRGQVGPYQMQAAIAACHAEAQEAAATDWPAIAWVYEQLARAMPSPVVELNLAVAVAMAEGLAAGLARLEAIEGQLERYYLFHATRADLLRRAGRGADAVTSYRAALQLVGSEAERRFLTRRLAEVRGPQST